MPKSPIVIFSNNPSPIFSEFFLIFFSNFFWFLPWFYLDFPDFFRAFLNFSIFRIFSNSSDFFWYLLQIFSDFFLWFSLILFGFFRFFRIFLDFSGFFSRFSPIFSDTVVQFSQSFNLIKILRKSNFTYFKKYEKFWYIFF